MTNRGNAVFRGFIPTLFKLRFFITGMLFLVALVIGMQFYLYRSQIKLDAMIEETDRIDPGWRLEQTEPQRPAPHSAGGLNNLEIIQAAVEHFPKPLPWPCWPFPQYDNNKSTALVARMAMTNSLNGPARTSLLNDEQLRVLHQELERARSALELLRRLPDVPARRPAEGDASWKLIEQGWSHQLMSILEYDARLRAHDNDMGGAISNVRGMLSLARAAGDDPSFSMQWRRLNSDRAPIVLLQRILALGETSDANLAAIQRELEEEAATPFLLIGFRGERARIDGFLERLQRGEISLEETQSLIRSPVMAMIDSNNALGRIGDKLREYFDVRNERANLLRDWMPIIELARMDPADRLKMFGQRPSTWPTTWLDHKMYFSPEIYTFLMKEADERQRILAGTCALAAERFRMARGRWPSQLEELIPQFLTQNLDLLSASPKGRLVREGSTFKVGDFVLYDPDQRR